MVYAFWWFFVSVGRDKNALPFYNYSYRPKLTTLLPWSAQHHHHQHRRRRLLRHNQQKKTKRRAYIRAMKQQKRERKRRVWLTRIKHWNFKTFVRPAMLFARSPIPPTGLWTDLILCLKSNHITHLLFSGPRVVSPEKSVRVKLIHKKKTRSQSMIRVPPGSEMSIAR